MPATKDKLLEAIEAVHAAGLEEELWPDPLGAATRLLGANCATLETLETPNLQHLDFRGFNIPPANQLLYLRDYVPLSPRTRFAASRRKGDLLWDYKMITEAAIDHDPFYQGFLKQVDLRYFFGGVIEHNGHEMTAATFHRARKQGHADRGEIALLQRLMPHFRQAYGVTQRLREARGKVGAFQSALDWLADGVALLAADGTVLYANQALEDIARRNDGIKIARRTIRLGSNSAAAHLAAALGALARLGAGDAKAEIMHDFSVTRPANAPPYLLSVRPVTHSEAGRLTRRTPAVLLFVHDPLQQRHRRAAKFFREALGLTEAEANLALALQEGMAVTDYARDRALSLNTAYTHLRRIKEKTGCKHMAELIRWLNDLRLPLRTLLLGFVTYLRLMAEALELGV
jgi:DNA-binding CsgD family transcriptional regulator/PAS domain-containing protein